MLKKASLLIPGTYISRYVGPKLKTIFALFYFRAFLNIFSNMLMPLFWTYLGRPRNVGQRNKRGCFWHPPIQQLSKTQKIYYNSPFLQVIHSEWLIIKTRLFRRHTGGYQIWAQINRQSPIFLPITKSLFQLPAFKYGLF